MWGIMLTFLLNILSIVTGQLGPNYDPLFYDVMIYIIAIVLGSFILMIVSIVYVLLKRSKHKKYGPKKMQEETQFWVCPNCGGNTQMKDSRQYCPSCKFYLSI